MSRSRRKHPVLPWNTGESDARDKRAANRTLRRVVRMRVATDTLPVLREVSNVRGFTKDCRHWQPRAAKGMRK